MIEYLLMSERDSQAIQGRDPAIRTTWGRIVVGVGGAATVAASVYLHTRHGAEMPLPEDIATFAEVSAAAGGAFATFMAVNEQHVAKLQHNVLEG